MRTRSRPAAGYGRCIYAALGDRFAKWQWPDEVLFVDAIPKRSVGKLSKKSLRAEYKDDYPG